MTDYTDLLANAASTLQRTDLTAYIPSWVRYAEAELSRLVHTRETVEFATFNISASRVLLPDQFAGVETFMLSQPFRPLGYVTPDQMDELEPQTGCPQYYTVIGDSFTFWPSPDDVLPSQLRYRTTLEALASVGTNWMSQKHPDAYLYGTLKHSAPFLQEDSRVQTWQGLFNEIVGQINTDGNRQVQGSRLQTRNRWCNP